MATLTVDLKVSDQNSSYTLVCLGSVLWECFLFTGRPPVVYACDELRKEESAIERSALSSLLYITSRANLQEGPFSHHPSVSEAVALHINGPNGLTTGTRPSPSFFLPLTLLLCLCVLSLPFPVCSFLSLFLSLSFHICLSRFLSILFSAFWLSCP